MKNFNLILCALLSLFAVACTQPAPPAYTILGEVNGQAEMAYLQRFVNKEYPATDSCVVVDGKFQFKGSIGLPELYRVSLAPGNQYVEFFLENSEINVLIDKESRRNSKATGSAADSVYREYLQSNDIEAMIKKYPRSAALAYCLYRMHTYDQSPETLRSQIALFDTLVINQSVYIKGIQDLIMVYERVLPGKPYIEIALPDPDGKVHKLSDMLGNYILLDFWAAWCGPCRQENPNLVKAYKKYHPKGFQIYAVSLDSSKEAWVKAIADDNLPWTHVSDLVYWQCAPAADYGARAIPTNFLIGPDGNIVAKNIRGEELQKKLEEIYGKK